MSGYAIRANASSGTLLSCALLTSPDPLQAGATGARLTLGVANPAHQPVTLASLAVTLPRDAPRTDPPPRPDAHRLFTLDPPTPGP